MTLTEFHFVVVYRDRISAFCHLNEKMTYEEILPLVRIVLVLQYCLTHTDLEPQ